MYSSEFFLKLIKLAHIRNRVVSEVKFPLDAIASSVGSQIVR